MNTTANLGLKKPEYSDQADIGDINYNMEILDDKLGAVGNTSVQGQINAVNTTIGSTVLPTTAQTLTGAIAEHETDIGTKADKVASATNGHFAGLDGNGNLTDSGKQISDFVGKTYVDDTAGTAGSIAKSDSTEEAVKTFTDGADNIPMRNCVVQIEPVQSGSGDPAPDNVRPISGWTGANISRTNGKESTDPDYVGNTYSISWQNEAGTVYHGSINPITGVLTADFAGKTVSDCDWEYDSDYTRFKTTISGIRRYSSQRMTPMYCSAFAVIDDGRAIANVPDNAIYGGGTNTSIYIKNTTYTDATQFKTAFADVQIVYPLATPVTYQLTTTEIRTLFGDNNIWADCGNIISVDYYADTKTYIDNLFATIVPATGVSF